MSGIQSQLCAVCEKELNRHEKAVGLTCASLNCKSEHAHKTGNDLTGRQEKVAEKTLRLVNQNRSKEGLQPVSKILKIPYIDCKEAIPSKQRINNFKANLKSAIRKTAAQAHDTPHSDEQSEESSANITSTSHVLQAGCATCGGSCCSQGGEHAFLHSEIIRKRLLARPLESPAAIYRDYIRHLPVRSVEGSCVYHTSTGCSLTREMRADVCNTYECWDLDEVRSLTEKPGWAPLVLIAMAGTSAARFSIVDQDTLGVVTDIASLVQED